MSSESLLRHLRDAASELNSLLRGVQEDGKRAFSEGDYLAAQDIADQAKHLAKIKEQLDTLVGSVGSVVPQRTVAQAEPLRTINVTRPSKPARTVSVDASAEATRPPAKSRSEPIEMFRRDGVHAFGEYLGGPVEIHAGSTISLEKSSLRPAIRDLRNKLLESHELEYSQTGNYLELRKAQRFSSMSTAAQFVAGCSVDGWVEWQNAITKEPVKRPSR